MDLGSNASRTLHRLKTALDQISWADLLLKALPITLEEQTRLPTNCDVKEKIDFYLNAKLEEGDSACQECLRDLEERIHEVPELAIILRALTEYVENHFGKEIVNDILATVDSKAYISRTFFQYTVLRQLLEDNKFEQYVEYINKYEMFVKQWMITYIKDMYKKPGGLGHLHSNLLSLIIPKIQASLRDPKTLESLNVRDFLDKVCNALKKELVVSQDNMKAIIFQNSTPVRQFSTDIESFLKQTASNVLSKMKDFDIESVLSKVTIKPEDELFKKVFGCGKQCPFCKVPCEAGAADHKEHFASVHRPQGLGRYRFIDTNVLCCSLCSTDVVSNKSFRNSDTGWVFHPYKDYTAFYPDWSIQPDPSIGASDYWKFILKEFNDQFAKEYKAKPAEIPDDWHEITREKAIQNLKETFRLT